MLLPPLMTRSLLRSSSVRKPSSFEPADVAGAEPAVADRRRGGLGLLPIALHHDVTAHAHLADLAGGQQRTVGIADRQLEHRLRIAHRRQTLAVARVRVVVDDVARQHGDRHRAFALAVDLREVRADHPQGVLDVGQVHRPTAVGDGRQPLGLAGRLATTWSTRRRTMVGAAKNDACRQCAASSTTSAGSKAARGRHHVDTGMHHVGQVVQPATVRQRRRVQHHVADGDALHLAQVAQAGHAQLASSQHHALRPTGGATGVEQPRRVGVTALDGLGDGGCIVAAAQATRHAMTWPRPTAAICASASVSTKARRAPLCCRIQATSRGCSLALIGTAAAPAHQVPHSITRYSGRLAMNRPTRSPGSTPWPCSHAAKRAARSVNSA